MFNFKRQKLEVHHDELTNLDYVDSDDYLQSGLFTRLKYYKLFANDYIASYFAGVSRELISFFAYSESMIEEDMQKDYIQYIIYLNELYFDLSYAYFESQIKEGAWQYVDFTFDDMLKDEGHNVSAEEIFGDDSDYYLKIFEKYREYAI